jgi:hypothetical protein
MPRLTHFWKALWMPSQPAAEFGAPFKPVRGGTWVLLALFSAMALAGLVMVAWGLWHASEPSRGESLAVGFFLLAGGLVFVAGLSWLDSATSTLMRTYENYVYVRERGIQVECMLEHVQLWPEGPESNAAYELRCSWTDQRTQSRFEYRSELLPAHLPSVHARLHLWAKQGVPAGTTWPVWVDPEAPSRFWVDVSSLSGSEVPS